MESNLGRLISFENERGLELIGMLFEGRGYRKAIVIHVHGNYGNFYTNKFIWKMSKIYPRYGIDFLTFNLSSHDGLAEGYLKGNLEYIGSAVSPYKESILDIKAAIKFVSKLGYSKIILQGHSLGCDKILSYCKMYNNKIDIVLLSPVDSFAVQQHWVEANKLNSIDQQKKEAYEISKYQHNMTWMSLQEYGAYSDTKEWHYTIPITAGAFYSLLNSDAFSMMNVLNEDIRPCIDNNAIIISPENDSLLQVDRGRFYEVIRLILKNATFVQGIEADHDLIGAEVEVSNIISQWIRNNHY